MTARCAVSPVYVVDCDGCGITFEPTANWDRSHENAARAAARRAGWTVRPAYGKGSRSAPDYCPSCAAGGESK